MVAVVRPVPPPGTSAVPNAGSDPVTPTSGIPVVPAAVAWNAEVVSPIKTPLTVNVVAPDPPCGTVTVAPVDSSVPVTSGMVTAAATVPDAGVKVITPVLALFAKAKVPKELLATPSVGVAVKAGDAPARICPAAPVMDTTPVVAETATGAVPVVATVP